MLRILLFLPIVFLTLSNEVCFANNKNNVLLSESLGNSNRFNKKDNTKNIIKLTNIGDILKKNNEELKILESQILQFESLYKSKLSLWYPKLILNSSNLPSFETGTNDIDLSEDTYTKKLTTSLNFNLEWDLLNFSRNPEIEIAKLNLETSKVKYKIKYRDLFLETLTNFLLFKSSIEEIKVAEKVIAISEISLNDAKARFAAGIGNKLEVLESETQLEKDRQFLAKAIGDAKKKEKALKRSLNFQNNDLILGNEKFQISGIWNFPIKISLQEAKENREELQNINLKKKINKNDIDLSSSGKKPKLSIYNTYSISSVKGEEDQTTPDYNKIANSEKNIVGLKFNWTLFDGGKTKHNFKSLKEKDKELEREYRAYLDELENNIEDNFVDLNLSTKNILTSYAQINSSEEALKLSMQRLKAGVASQREVLLNLSDFTESKSRFIKAITEYNINIERLKTNTGIIETLNCNSERNANNEFIINEVYEDIDLKKFKNICNENILEIL